MKVERQTVHVNDDSGRIAMLEKRTLGTDPSPASLLRYIYSNHLQSASLELDENAAIISYEEYHPYGTTSYQVMNASINAVAKRYRYTGKERDEESGLYYHGARYYIPWLARWTAVDPSESKNTPKSSYCYCSGNPVSKFDPDGRDEIYFNFLTVNRHRFPASSNNVDANRPENLGLRTMDQEYYKWVTVVKNDQPNTYHILNHTLDVPVSGDAIITSYEEVFRKSEGQGAYYYYSNTPSQGAQERLFNAVNTLKGTLGGYYAGTISQKSNYPSQRTQNDNEVYGLLADTKRFFEKKEVEDLTNSAALFAIELLVTELLVLKLARGFNWFSRVGEKSLETVELTTTERLQYYVTKASKEVDELGDAAFTIKQLQAIQRNPNLRAMVRGNRIDVRARGYIMEDEVLKYRLKSNYSKGPDFIDKKTGEWWDMTTPGEWEKHINKYKNTFGPNGTLLKTN